MRRFVPAMALAALACLAFVTPALALDLNPADYFQINYQPIAFDKTQVGPGDTFHTTIKGQAVCMKSIPVPVSEATITSQVVARSAAAGASYTLNPGFTIDINPFPDKQGETYNINQPLDLQFPPDASPGQYQVVWELSQARAKISFVWTDVTGNLPAEQSMGTVTVTATGQSTSPSGAPPTTSSPATQASPAPTGTTPSTPADHAGVPLGTAWWVLPLVVVVGAAIIVFVIIFIVRHRHD
jgi:hypothetical protein